MYAKWLAPELTTFHFRQCSDIILPFYATVTEESFLPRGLPPSLVPPLLPPFSLGALGEVIQGLFKRDIKENSEFTKNIQLSDL